MIFKSRRRFPNSQKQILPLRQRPGGRRRGGRGRATSCSARSPTYTQAYTASVMGTATTNTALKIVSQIVIPHSPSVPLMLLRPDTLPEPFITYMDIFAADIH